MAEALLIPAAKGILTGLLSLATNQMNNPINLAWGFKQDLKKLCERLEIIQGFLHDAEDRKITPAAMMAWLKNLKAATCDAENVLDELAYEALRRKIEVRNPMMNTVRDFFSLSDPVSFRFKMANKVKDINQLLDRIRKAAKDVGLKPFERFNDATAEPGELRTTRPCIDDTKVVGRDGDVSVVVNMLLGSVVEGDSPPVIAIVGMPGLGKTTLAQVVYNEAKVLKDFGDERMWICVSDNFKVERLLNEMVQSLSGDTSTIQNGQGVVRKLREKLNGKKYLLVLDDVWNTDPNLWIDLRSSLIGIGDSKESKILVTTRSMEVVLAMQTSPSCIHQLAELSLDDCWTMFRKKAFARGGPKETQTLSDIGRRMVEKCKGVPLAVNALGGLLYSKQDEQGWQSIEKSDRWISPENNKGILPVLRLSFDHLPSPSLKQSFAYCSIFRKDEVIIKDELIQLWMCLGYLQPPSRSKLEMEELGNEYFYTLWRNSLFQEVRFDEYNNITSCKMHDLVHDLALHVSHGNCLTLEASEVKNNPDVQHLSLCLREETRLEISEENVRKLRTLFITGDLPKNTKDIKRIRALRLVESSAEELPSSICKSIHLRFLDLSKSFAVNVPNLITKLYNLETLKLPSSVKELPKDFNNLVSLRHFYLEDTKQNRELMPLKIGELTSLQTLPFFVVGKESGQRIEELGSLSKLRGSLHVYDLQYVKDKEEAEKAKMLEKSDIKELRLRWDGDFGMSDNNDVDVLEGLKPHQNVKGLVLKKFRGRRLASWMSRDTCSLQNLVKIVLTDCRLCERVPTLGHLPCLATVEMVGLNNLKRIGPEFYGPDKRIIGNCSSSGATAAGVFPALREFKLIDMPQLECWSDVSLPAVTTSTMESFPDLQKLFISNCPKLITIPGHLLSIQQLLVTSGRTYHDKQEMRYNPSLLIMVDADSKDIAILMEDLLKKSSESLRDMAIVSMNGLSYFPNQAQNLVLLEKLEIYDCHNLMGPIDEAKASFNGLTSLQQLSIKWCPVLTCLPNGLLQPTLVDICLYNCPKLKMPNPDALHSLTSLKKLNVKLCPALGSCWEEGQICTTNLQSLVIGYFEEEFRYFPWPCTSAASPPWCHFTSLEFLVLVGWPEVKSLPDQLEYLPVLRDLVIQHFMELESLPEWLANLSSLQSLKISGCPLLEKRCTKGSGEDWHKIAHIPSIQIDPWE